MASRVQRDFGRQILITGGYMGRIKGIIGAIATAAVGASVQAASFNKLDLNALPRGQYFNLTQEVAQSMNINLEKLMVLTSQTSAENLAFQIAEDGEIDLAIYKNKSFERLLGDVVREAQTE